MTRRLVGLMLIVTWCGVAGCAQLPWIQGNETEAQKPGPRPLLLPPGFTTATESMTTIEEQKIPFPLMVNPTKADQPSASASANLPVAAQSPAAVPLAPPPPLPTGLAVSPMAVSPTASYTAPQPLPAAPVPGYAQLPASAPTPQLAGPKSPFPSSGREPIIDAFDLCMQGKDYLAALDRYDPGTRELLARLLPLMVNVAQKKLSAAEESTIPDHLHKIIQAMLPRTELVIDTVCFCESVKAFGNYQPLPDKHIFQAPTASRSGERVQLYVELRNFDSVKIDEFYETRLASFVQICDSNGKEMWKHSFDEKGKTIRSRSLRHDYFNTYSLNLPNLPHGTYSLTVRIVDLTRPEFRREKSKSITFQVGSNPM